MFSWRDPPRRPLLVAHRGSSLRAAENTLSAFARAIGDGADAIECDVQLTRDGHLVVIHDFTLTRTAGRRGRVDVMLLEDLRRLNAGGKRSQETIPLLEEVCDLVGEAVGLNVELKVPRGSRRGEELLTAVLRTLRARRRLPSTLVSSFNHRLIAAIAPLEARLATGLLLTPLDALRPPFGGTAGIDYLIAGRRSISRRFVERCRLRGLHTGVFTVNDPADARRCTEAGVTMIVTDDPLGLREVFP